MTGFASLNTIGNNSADVGFLSASGTMAELIRSKDWSSTPLGPMSTWPQSLRTTVSLCLASTFPINIVWGPQAVQIYNDGYRIICGERHPASLGMDYRACWKSAWPAIGAPFDEASRGETSFLENQRMFLFRNGYLEETFFTFSLSPIRDESGGIGGLFHPVTETTATMISERRTRAVRDLTANLAGAQSLQDVVNCTVRTLEAFAFDLPLVLLYTRDARDGAWRRMGHTGVSQDSPLAPDVLDPSAWPLTQAGALRETSGIAARCGDLPCGPYDEAPDTGFALPVWYTGSSEPVALLITAASPRLPLDELYRGFFELLGAAFGAAVSRVMRQEEERERLASLAALDRAKTQFFSNVSHEFRTPLTLMLGPLEEVLDDAALQARPRALLDIAQRNAQRLLKLVNGLLDFTRMEDGRNAATFVPTDLARLTLDLSSNFRAACERVGLTLDVACPPLPEPVWVDRDSWEKIILNLLSNAFKFTLTGAIRVSLQHDPDADGVILTVADSGVGIPPEHVDRIFERFHRVDGQQGRSVDGTGIGLALVQEMVALHGGVITVQSQAGAGTVFQVRLPFGHAHLPAAQVASAPVEFSPSARATPFVDEALRWIPGSGAALEENAAIAPGSSGAVVLADDNADMRDYVERVLANAGYRVTTVSNGAAALAALRTGPLPDLLLSDVTMPELDGFALLDAVRADPVASELVVILLSARAGQEARVQGLEAGADDYLVKPFSAKELIARVDGAVKLARLRKDAATREHALRLVIATRDSRDALERSQAQVTSLFEQTATGVLQAELDGRLRRVNGRFAAMLGVNEDVLAGRPLLALVHPDERSKLEQALRAMRASQQPAQLDLRFPQADGGVAWVTMAFTPFAAGATLLAVVLDISERVEAEQKLRRADRSKDEFLAMLAHELRNPLAPISAAAELMSRVDLDAERLRRTSGVITRQVRHMTGLVDDLLDVSRVTLGLVLVEKTVQDMEQVVADAVEQVRPLIDAHRHTLTVDIDTGGGTVAANVLGDRKRLVQVLSNLLNNAAKYTPPGGCIGIALRVEGDAVSICVSDNGPGVPAELQLRLFELFAQAVRTPDRSQGGLGLGLALARKLVELHGGSIEIENKPGVKGSSFVVTLPRELEPSAIGEDHAGEEGSNGPVRVLVVDDNVDAADTLGMLLDAYGYQTIVEHGSPEGLATARLERPDVCILDIGLPGMDGNVLAQQLRADPRTRGALLIALTGYSQPQDRERSLAAGFDHHLAKPANIDRLVELLAELAPGVPAA
jgi:PAS domain S-box-containing protein